jgi:hypothetical protein
MIDGTYLVEDVTINIMEYGVNQIVNSTVNLKFFVERIAGPTARTSSD